jgi:hypothetical protein
MPAMRKEDCFSTLSNAVDFPLPCGPDKPIIGMDVDALIKSSIISVNLLDSVFGIMA